MGAEVPMVDPAANPVPIHEEPDYDGMALADEDLEAPLAPPVALGPAGETTALANAIHSITQGKDVQLVCGLKCMMLPAGQVQLYGNDNETGPSDPAANIVTNFATVLETQRKTHQIDTNFVKTLVPGQLMSSFLAFNFSRDHLLLLHLAPGNKHVTVATATIANVLSSIEALIAIIGAGNPRLAVHLTRTLLISLKEKIGPVTPPAALIDWATNYFKWCSSLASSAKTNEPSYNRLLTVSSNVQSIIARDARNRTSPRLLHLDNRVSWHLDQAVTTSAAVAAQALAALASLQARVDLLEKQPRASSASSAPRASGSGSSYGSGPSNSGGRFGSYGGSSSSAAPPRSDLSGLRNMCGKFVRNKHCSRDCKTVRGLPLGHATEFAKFSSTERADIKRCAIAAFGV